MLPWALAAGLAIGLTRRRFNRWVPKSLLLAGMAIQAGGLLWLARSGEERLLATGGGLRDHGIRRQPV